MLSPCSLAVLSGVRQVLVLLVRPGRCVCCARVRRLDEAADVRMQRWRAATEMVSALLLWWPRALLRQEGHGKNLNQVIVVVVAATANGLVARVDVLRVVENVRRSRTGA